ncbi:sugar phosphate permease [Planctomyces sp. SCGC AG-212-M04]|nr:sugar phosphate permease [Planctomyces sp. SCGC AG-212-M04]
MTDAIDGPPAETPTRVRYRVLAMVCGLSMITYLDRVAMGAAAPSLAKELSLSSTAELKWAFTAFMIAYAVFEIPSGWLGDRLGPRITLIRIVLLWSIFTALTGVVGMKIGSTTLGGLTALAVVRFLFGAGEAGAYPNITRALHNWFPVQQWETAQGWIWMSGRLMGGLTPLIWAILVGGTAVTAPLVTWRGAFLLFGVLGVVWCGLFATWFRDNPEQHPAVSESERALIRERNAQHSGTTPVDWQRLLRNPGLWALCVMYSLVNYGWAFNITYLPSYLQLRFEVAESDLLGALYKGAPLWVGAAGCLLGGQVINVLSKRCRDRRQARQVLGVLAMSGCAVCWFAVRSATNVHVFSMLVALAAFCVDLTLGAVWATCQDLGRPNVAVAAACMNTIGTLGAAFANWLTGTIVERSLAARGAALHVAVGQLSAADKQAASMAGYEKVFLTYSLAYVVAAVCWVMVRQRKA